MNTFIEPETVVEIRESVDDSSFLSLLSVMDSSFLSFDQEEIEMLEAGSKRPRQEESTMEFEDPLGDYQYLKGESHELKKTIQGLERELALSKRVSRKSEIAKLLAEKKLNDMEIKYHEDTAWLEREMERMRKACTEVLQMMKAFKYLKQQLEISEGREHDLQIQLEAMKKEKRHIEDKLEGSNQQLLKNASLKW